MLSGESSRTGGCRTVGFFNGVHQSDIQRCLPFSILGDITIYSCNCMLADELKPSQTVGKCDPSSFEMIVWTRHEKL